MGLVESDFESTRGVVKNEGSGGVSGSRHTLKHTYTGDRQKLS